MCTQTKPQNVYKAGPRVQLMDEGLNRDIHLTQKRGKSGKKCAREDEGKHCERNFRDAWSFFSFQPAIISRRGTQMSFTRLSTHKRRLRPNGRRNFIRNKFLITNWIPCRQQRFILLSLLLVRSSTASPPRPAGDAESLWSPDHEIKMKILSRPVNGLS